MIILAKELFKEQYEYALNWGLESGNTFNDFMVKWSTQVPKGTVGAEVDRLEDSRTGITAIRLIFPNHEQFWFLSTQLVEIKKSSV